MATRRWWLVLCLDLVFNARGRGQDFISGQRGSNWSAKKGREFFIYFHGKSPKFSRSPKTSPLPRNFGSFLYRNATFWCIPIHVMHALMKLMKLPILPCAEKLELVLSTAPKTWDNTDSEMFFNTYSGDWFANVPSGQTPVDVIRYKPSVTLRHCR